MGIKELGSDGYEYESIMYPYNRKNALVIRQNSKSLDKFILHVNDNKLEQAAIYMENLAFLDQCPTLKYLWIYPPMKNQACFDISPLYSHPEVRLLECGNYFGEKLQHITDIDYARINGLIDLAITVSPIARNALGLGKLKSLRISGFRGKKGDLSDLFDSNELDTLTLGGCHEKSLDGIETSRRMQCLYIDYNRSLVDISALRNVKDTLKALRIANCSQIQDYSVLGELRNVEYLYLKGNFALQDISFIKSMKNLKTLILQVKDVEDGDLTPCLDLSYCYCGTIKKHYNVKAKDLPQGAFLRGNESIEEWRRVQ